MLTRQARRRARERLPNRRLLRLFKARCPSSHVKGQTRDEGQGVPARIAQARPEAGFA